MFPRCFTAIGTGAVGALCPGGEEAGRARVLASGPGCGRINRRPAWRPTIPSFAVLTSSDTGAREADFADVSGDTVVEMMLGAGFDLSDRRLLPDDEDALAGAIQEWCDRGGIDIVLTTGGTGLGPRDVAPQATARVVEYEVPGIPEAIRSRTFEKAPMAMISRAKAGVRGRTLVLNLPGSPRAVRECLEVALPVLAHAVEMLGGAGWENPQHRSTGD